jgi:hypothetical protein
MDRSETLRLLIKSITSISTGDIYLFGSSLRNYVLNYNATVIDVIVDEKCKVKQKDILNIKSNITVNFIFRDFVDYSHEFYTIDTIYAKLDNTFNGNIEVLSTNNGLVDLNKKIIKLTKSGKTHVLNNSKFILDTISFISENDFILDIGTIYSFLSLKSGVKDIDSKTIFHFIKNIIKYKHPRKTVSLINTLGISKELFNVSLLETPVVNNLKKEDYCEFLAIVFSEFEPNDFHNPKFGFPPKDIIFIEKINKCISIISDENIETALKIIDILDGGRVPNMIRLLKALSFNKLAKLIKERYKFKLSINNICLTPEMIKASFNINSDDDIKYILDLALEKIIIDPTYNEEYRILNYINNQRNKNVKTKEN